jgi:phytol kinase
MMASMDLATVFPAADLAVAAVITVLFCALFAAAEAWWRALQPPVEYTRKSVHVGCGLIAAPLPWLIDSPWTMLLLGSAFVGIVAFTRRMGWLPCLHAVERCSHGATLYPASIFLTYLLALHTGRPELYCAAVLVLAVSDAAASLIGIRFGRHRLQVEGDVKSIEGCIAFFATAHVIVFSALALLTDLPLAVCLLSATYAAGLGACIELVSRSGTDNLFIPLAVFGILLKVTTERPDEIFWQLGLLALDLALVTVLLRRQKILDAGGIITLGLVTHAVLGSLGAYVVLVAIAGMLAHAFRTDHAQLVH